MGPSDLGETFQCFTISHIMEHVICRIYEYQLLLWPRLPDGPNERIEKFGRFKPQFKQQMNLRIFVTAPDNTPANARSWDLEAYMAELAEKVPELYVIIHDDACHVRRFASKHAGRSALGQRLPKASRED